MIRMTLCGGELVLIDATHNVIKYKTPQFMLAVPTNCGYESVVLQISCESISNIEKLTENL